MRSKTQGTASGHLSALSITAAGLTLTSVTSNKTSAQAAVDARHLGTG